MRRSINSIAWLGTDEYTIEISDDGETWNTVHNGHMLQRLRDYDVAKLETLHFSKGESTTSHL